MLWLRLLDTKDARELGDARGEEAMDAGGGGVKGAELGKAVVRGGGDRRRHGSAAGDVEARCMFWFVW